MSGVNSSVQSRQERSTERVGTVLRGKYHLDELIGMGGMAAVYAATHRNGKRVAIKILHPEAAVVPEIRSRFLREGYLANRVDHPGAPSILDDDFDEHGVAYLVMELLQGENLDDRARRYPGGRLPAAEALLIAAGVLDVLAAAHKKGIIHRDLKPSNLFVLDTGEVKVLDFGIARLHTPISGPGETLGPLGTPGFIPPEQARGRSGEVGPHTDLWSLGATLFCLLSGRTVHDAETVGEQLVAAMTKAAPPIESVCEGLDESVCHVVNRALAFEPAARWPSASFMREAVRTAYHATTGQDLPASSDQLSSGGHRKRNFGEQATVPASTGTGNRTPAAMSLKARTLPHARSRLKLALAGASAIGAIALATLYATTRVNAVATDDGTAKLHTAARVGEPSPSASGRSVRPTAPQARSDALMVTPVPEAPASTFPSTASKVPATTRVEASAGQRDPTPTKKSFFSTPAGASRAEPAAPSTAEENPDIFSARQ